MHIPADISCFNIPYMHNKSELIRLYLKSNSKKKDNVFTGIFSNALKRRKKLNTGKYRSMILIKYFSQ